MKKDKHITKVVFRVFSDGEVIAMFPEHSYIGPYYMTEDYMHIGQHGHCDYHNVIQKTRPASEEDYRELKAELESIGYNLKVVKRAKIVYKSIYK